MHVRLSGGPYMATSPFSANVSIEIAPNCARPTTNGRRVTTHAKTRALHAMFIAHAALFIALVRRFDRAPFTLASVVPAQTALWRHRLVGCWVGLVPLDTCYVIQPDLG